MKNYATLDDALTNSLDDNFGLTYVTGKNNEQYVSYKALKSRASRLLTYLRDQGVKEGDQIIIFTSNNCKLVDCFWASIFGNIVAVPLESSMTKANYDKFLNVYGQLESPFVFLEGLTKDFLVEKLGEESPICDRMIVGGEDVYLQCSEGEILDSDPTDCAFIQFSSGSTSEPKGVTITHENVLANIEAIATDGKLTQQDYVLGWIPLTHDLGMIGVHLLMVYLQANTCIIDTALFARRPSLWLQKASDIGATVLVSPNFGYKHALKHLTEKQKLTLDLSRVRIIFNGAEPISTDLCDRFQQELLSCGLRESAILPVYGLAEASLVVAFGDPGQAFQRLILDRNRLGPNQVVKQISPDLSRAVTFPVVGNSIKHSQFRIGDIDDGYKLPDFTVGEILISGKNVTKGYFRYGDRNSEYFTEDGWLKTGDLGFTTESGELVVTGRLKEMIISNGKCYYPHDIEYCLDEQGLSDMGRAACVGVASQSDASQENVLIFVSMKNNIDKYQQLKTKINSSVMGSYGLAVHEVVPIKNIPKTSSGKIRRTLLAKQYLDGNFAADIKRYNQALMSADDELMSPLERELMQLLKRASNRNDIKKTDNLFSCGMESISLAEFHSLIEDSKPGLVHIMDMYDHPTIEKLSQLINRTLGADVSSCDSTLLLKAR